MLRSRLGEATEPRTVTLRATRMTAIMLSVVVAPFGLAACGLIGGGSSGNGAPVVLSEDPQSGATELTPEEETTSADAGQVSPGSTVTSTDLRLQTRTAVATKISTRPAVTVTSVAPPVTVTNNRTVTDTVTRTVISPAAG